MATVIVGGGIVGVTAALYLLKKGKKVECAMHNMGQKYNPYNPQ